MQNRYVIVFIVVWNFLYHLQLLSQIWTLQNASLQKRIMKPKPVQYLQYVDTNC